MTDRPPDYALAQAFWETDSIDGDGSYRFEEKVIARAREIAAAAPGSAQPIAFRYLMQIGNSYCPTRWLDMSETIPPDANKLEYAYLSAPPVVSSPVEATAVASHEQGEDGILIPSGRAYAQAIAEARNNCEIGISVEGEITARAEEIDGIDNTIGVQEAYTSHQGSTCIDWDDDPKNQFSIIVKDGRVTYAAYRDGAKVFGVAKGSQFMAALRGFAAAGGAQEMHCGYLVDGVDFYYPDFPRSEWRKYKTVVPVYLGQACAADTELLDWLEDTVQGAHVSMCFELDGGVHLTIEAPSSEPVAYRERNTIREAITAAIKEKASRS